ncbi:hypothetical protein CBER1_02861 [Cercospora berteroae]|uniref:Prefoldin subunit 4 n=1 Tax=Cercospora berteroae TaxID=357750 RepID=A0A2S6BQH5_9PEZI|nr:hypothetical protein CBER1_02861 [Cercospora berteroae]
MATACATCASRFDSPLDPVSEKPLLPGRDLDCCGRAICSRCLNQNKRYETYCPYCQITTEPSLLPQGLKDPPAYSDDRLPPRRTVLDDEPPAYSEHQPVQPLLEKQNHKVAEDVLHFLTPNDSMSSLSLAYGVPIDALRKTNNVFADHLIQGRKTVLIPGEYYKGGVSLSPQPIESEEEELKKNKIRRWQVACKVAEYDVAQLYLKNAEWDLQAAIDAYRDDEQWEKDHPLEAKQQKKGKGVKMLSRRMLSREEEAEIGEEKEVRKEDQDKINRFSRLHSREKGLEEELKVKQKDKEDLEEISGELELADEDEKVPYKIGDSFFNLPVSEVQELLSAAVERIDGEVSAVEEKLSEYREEMQTLKTALYGRFGKSINLEV